MADLRAVRSVDPKVGWRVVKRVGSMVDSKVEKMADCSAD